VNNRFALCDDVDSSSASSIVASVASITSGDGGYGMFLAPWVIIPATAVTTVTASPAAATRTVPPSALVAALIASSDQNNNAGVPAAGNNGISNYAMGVTNSYVESDRGLLNTAGVSVIRNMNGLIKLYGYVSFSSDPRWVPASFGRMRMSIVSQLHNAATPFAFQQIDGQGHLLSAFNGALAGVCQNLWQQGALYGNTAELAFSVNTGPQVNTPVTLAACQLLAAVNVRFSPYAEFVLINVVQYSVAQNIPS
jgi:hypothetical protein